MQLDVISSVIEARSDDFINKTIIVIDVLRATSTIITALKHGCSSVLPVETVCQAKNLQEANDLLGGERFCKKIAGFDFGNSPFEYMTPQIEGRRVIITTTNGTRAIQKTHKASNVLAGSMLNAAACIRTAIELKRDVMILCAGTQDLFSLEDGLCAGLLIEEFKRQYNDTLETNDFGVAMHYSYLQCRDRIEDVILDCENGKRLCKIGFKEDVIYCAKPNQTTVVPILRDQAMVPFAVLK